MKIHNNFLNTTSMLLAPADSNSGEPTENDTRSEAQKQRDSIEINGSIENKDKEETNDDTDDNDEEDDDSEDGDIDETEDNAKEETENKEETDEEKEIRLAKEKEARQEKRIQKRIDKAIAAQKAAEARAEAAEARLREQPVEGLTEEEVERRAAEKAAIKLAEQEALAAKKKFENTCDTLESVAIKTDKDFTKKILEVTGELGPIPAAIIEVLGDLEHQNGGQVLAYLADNIDEAEDLYELKSNPRRLDRALSKISDKLKELEKKPKKERSAVPSPIEPIGNSRQETTRITGKETQEEFNAKRAKQIAERQAQRGY